MTFKRLTVLEIAYLSRFVPGDDLRDLRFEVSWGPLWFLWWAHQGGVTWPGNGRVYLNPKVWATYLYPQRLSTLGHESVHVGQWRKMGPDRYLRGHLRGWLQVRDPVRRPLEVEAYDVGSKVYDYASQHPAVLPSERSV